MYRLFALVIGFMTLISLSSCSKEDDPVVSTGIVGASFQYIVPRQENEMITDATHIRTVLHFDSPKYFTEYVYRSGGAYTAYRRKYSASWRNGQVYITYRDPKSPYSEFFAMTIDPDLSYLVYEQHSYVRLLK